MPIYIEISWFSLLRCPISTNAVIEGQAYGFSEPTSIVEVLRELHIIVSRKFVVGREDGPSRLLNLVDFYAAEPGMYILAKITGWVY